MLSGLLEQLFQINSFSNQLNITLQKIDKQLSSQDCHKSALGPVKKNKQSIPMTIIKQLDHHLVSLSCQNKNLLHYKYLQNKISNEHSLAYIVQILTYTTNSYKGEAEYVANLFISHILSHPSCYISYYTFFMLLDSSSSLIQEVSFEKLQQINVKIQKQLNAYDDIKMLHSILCDQENDEVFAKSQLQVCERNLNQYLVKKFRPSKQKHKTESNRLFEKNSIIKIPPLAIPTTKSLSSQRYSAVSRQDRIKGLSELKKLASGLGESFITVQLGCLLANKRTTQVQQFSENQTYREACLERIQKIQTERMNSSRVSLLMGCNEELFGAQNPSPLNTQFQQNSKRYYNKVLTVNFNIYYQKLSFLKQKKDHSYLDFIVKKVCSIQKTRKSFKKASNKPQKQLGYFDYLSHFVRQIIDMHQTGVLCLTRGAERNHFKQCNQSVNNPGLFSLMLKKMKMIPEITNQLMSNVSQEYEKIHTVLLANQNKKQSTFHYAESEEMSSALAQQPKKSKQLCEIPMTKYSNKLFGDTQIRINYMKPMKGPFQLSSDSQRCHEQEIIQKIKTRSDPILLYLSNYLQSLQHSADMDHPLFYKYQISTLSILNYYLSQTSSTNKISSYYIAQFMTPLLIILKRQILQLSHPFFQSDPQGIFDYNCMEHHSIENTKKLHIKNIKAASSFARIPSPNKLPLIFSQPLLMAELIKMITNLLSSSQMLHQHNNTGHRHLERLISNIFLKNMQFMELVQHYTEHIFKREKVNEIAEIFKFYVCAVQVYNSSIYNRSHHGKTAHQSTTSHTHHSAFNQNKHIKFIYQHLNSYLEPKAGCIPKILNTYQKFITPNNLEEVGEHEFLQHSLIETNQRSEEQEPMMINPIKIQQFLHQIFSFLSKIYYISQPKCDFLCIFDQEIASFYIKYSIMGFIKLYSLLTVTELANINQSPHQKLQTDPLLSTKQSPHVKKQVNLKQVFMIDFLKILFSLSANRTPTLAKKFRQYRVLQFLTREIELEFSVAQNIQKYIKKAGNIIDVTQFIKEENLKREENISLDNSSVQYQQGWQRNQNQESSPFHIPQLNLNLGKETQIKKLNKQSFNPGKSKKVVVPGLNLGGDMFKKISQIDSSDKKYSKSFEENKSDKAHQPAVDNLNSSKKGKKMVPLLKLPLKTEQNPYSRPSSNQQLKSKKGYLDDLLQQIIQPSNQGSKKLKSKKQSLKTDFDLNLNLNFDATKNIGPETLVNNMSKSSKVHSQRNIIYQTERKIRKIYSNKTLHTQAILLILSLILYKGQLDPMYCDQLPIIHGKLNVLYLLHYHLNHESNQSILPILQQNIDKIRPYLAGQRLLKLLSNKYTDLSHYHSWSKISAGAFGVVMSAQTYLEQPKQVAIKQMNFPKSIYQRCVLHDIFSEIACLEMFRLEGRVSKMYNYGIVENCYVIIMKKYVCSIREWRISGQNGSQNQFDERGKQMKKYPTTLSNILSIFYQILKGLSIIHEQNVTHYDIKGDNILLEFDLQSSDSKQTIKPRVVFADFGVCKIYEDEEGDEFDMKSRGTQCIKSPQMLTLSLKNKKEADSFDRRRKIGTTRASDIWSLGCLLYELITGEFLFNSNDWVHFFMQVTSNQQQILNESQCQKMNNNIYLIDFIKYIMVRDPHHRPTIKNIITRFQNLYSLLVSNPERFIYHHSQDLKWGAIFNKKSLDQAIQQYIQNIKQLQSGQNVKKHKNSSAKDREKSGKSKSRPQSSNKNKQKRRVTQPQIDDEKFKMTHINPSRKLNNSVTKIMEDIYFCQNYTPNLKKKIDEQGITHIIMVSDNAIIPNLMQYHNNYKVFEICTTGSSQDYYFSLIYRLCPRVSDFIRQVLLLKGKILFINSHMISNNFIVNLLIFILSFWFKCSVYETWCLINTQILTFPSLTTNYEQLKNMSRMLIKLGCIERIIEQENYPKLQCICGRVTIILKKKFLQQKEEVRPCRCNKGFHGNFGSSRCFSPNCTKYLEFIKKRYNISWDYLTWALVNTSCLLTEVAPIKQESQSAIKSQIILNSAPPSVNMIQEPAAHNFAWRISSCRTCEMWIMASNQSQQWMILNNLIKGGRNGIMVPNAQQGFKPRTPALNNFTLFKLHMTQQ